MRQDAIVILHFQHKELMIELYENLKDELQINPLSLEIRIIDNKKLYLVLNSIEGKQLFISNELEYIKNELESFMDNINTKRIIYFHTDYLTIQGTAWPLGKWLTQQHDENRVKLSGYSITQINTNF